MLRATRVFPVHQAVQVSLALKEKPVSLEPLVFLAAPALLDQPVRLCSARKESKVHPGPLEEQVNLDHKVLVDPPEAAA